MRNYFDFQLKGKDLLSLWLILYLVFFLPYFLWVYNLQSFKNSGDKPPVWLVFLFIPLILIFFIWTLYLIRIVLEKIRLKSFPLQCDFPLSGYLKMVCLGLFLTIITFGIYAPWFFRNYERFFVNNSSWKGSNFAFRGEGKKLLYILVLSFVAPVILINLILSGLFGPEHVKNASTSYLFMRQLFTQIFLVPYSYLVYKWIINIDYKQFNIRWETEFWPSVRTLFIQLILSWVTFGIYFPMAFLRLYTYFMARTRTNRVEDKQLRMGYDLDPWPDFLYLWGQILLLILTIGIYYPWAFSKIGERILGKTYLEEI